MGTLRVRDELSTVEDFNLGVRAGLSCELRQSPTNLRRIDISISEQLLPTENLQVCGQARVIVATALTIASCQEIHSPGDCARRTFQTSPGVAG